MGPGFCSPASRSGSLLSCRVRVSAWQGAGGSVNTVRGCRRNDCTFRESGTGLTHGPTALFVRHRATRQHKWVKVRPRRYRQRLRRGSTIRAMTARGQALLEIVGVECSWSPAGVAHDRGELFHEGAEAVRGRVGHLWLTKTPSAGGRLLALWPGTALATAIGSPSNGLWPPRAYEYPSRGPSPLPLRHHGITPRPARIDDAAR